jgi:prolyl-tRNA synthetase
VDRIDRSKTSVPLPELRGRLPEILDAFQKRLLQRALALRESFQVEVSTRAERVAAFSGRNSLAHGPWCGDTECEIEVKDGSQGATIRVIDKNAPAPGASCAGCGKEAKHQVYWARAY